LVFACLPFTIRFVRMVVKHLQKFFVQRRLITVTFGTLLKQMRINRELSQRELATMVGTSQQNISLYERGYPCPPDIVVSLARALNAPKLIRAYCSNCICCKEVADIVKLKTGVKHVG